MSFPASTDSEPAAQAMEHVSHGTYDLDRYYAVAVHIHKDGHACASLTRLDMRTRRIVTERLGCSAQVPGTRGAALREISSAVTQALLDLDADTR